MLFIPPQESLSMPTISYTLEIKKKKLFPPQERSHAWYWKPRQLISANEAIVIEGEPITINFLNQRHP